MRHEKVPDTNIALLAAAAILFLALPYFSQRPLWRLSYDFEQLSKVEQTLAVSDPANILLLGDSSVAMLRPPDAPGDKAVTAVGIGGTGAEAWRYLLKHALTRGARPRHVVFATVNVANVSGVAGSTPLLPVLRGLGGAWHSLKDGELGPTDALQSAARAILPLTAVNDQVHFALLAPLSPWFANELMQLRPRPKRDGLPKGPLAAADRPQDERHLERLLAAVRDAGLEATFVLSPLAARVRENTNLLQTRVFAEICARHALRCRDLSGALPDSDFLADGVHVSPERREAFFRAVSGL